MNRRTYIRIVSFIAVALSILVAYTVINTGNMNTYKQQLEVGYQHSLEELAESLDTVNTDLTKSLYVNSPTEMLSLSRDLYAQCSVAKNAVSRLPAEQLSLGNTYKFLSQASDYAQYIGGKLERGEQLSEQEHENLTVLLSYAEKFSEPLIKLIKIILYILTIEVKALLKLVKIAPQLLSALVDRVPDHIGVICYIRIRLKVTDHAAHALFAVDRAFIMALVYPAALRAADAACSRAGVFIADLAVIYT